ncbi:Uu.00g100460.m01.CDS01 [Anthostomella pinea]|uniref:Uu.00g100460.m01.CDS01 n=1 Tax=Anthostomella pinea TaxID=933095 RepID=A0AAI8YF83_9PEZI|nr:Uu.00g100460.m01.CDS01 [Anthostomella pinea]
MSALRRRTSSTTRVPLRELPMWHRRVDNSSIFATLTDENPKLHQIEEELTSCPKPADPIRITQADVHRWTDFDYERVASSLGKILRSKFDNPIETVLEPRHLRVRVEENIDDVFNLWHGYILNLILYLLTPHLESFLGDGELNGFFFGKKPFSITNTEDGGDTYPDWGVATSGNRLLLGDTKMDQAWTSLDLEKGRKASLYAVQQLGQYCVRCNTRYGFIITPAELVVFRFYRIKEVDGEIVHVGSQSRSIPWSSYGQDELTSRAHYDQTYDLSSATEAGTTLGTDQSVKSPPPASAATKRKLRLLDVITEEEDEEKPPVSAALKHKPRSLDVVTEEEDGESIKRPKAKKRRYRL